MQKPITLETLHRLKQQKQPIAMSTVYDATFAKLLSQHGMEILLVGDSLGNVIQGHSTTVPVTIDDMIYHTRCVAKANLHSFIISVLTLSIMLFIFNPELLIQSVAIIANLLFNV